MTTPPYKIVFIGSAADILSDREREINGTSKPLSLGRDLLEKSSVASNPVISQTAKLVSQSHCTITMSKAPLSFYITDHSKNGTWINGIECKKQTPIPIKEDSEITIVRRMEGSRQDFGFKFIQMVDHSDPSANTTSTTSPPKRKNYNIPISSWIIAIIGYPPQDISYQYKEIITRAKDKAATILLDNDFKPTVKATGSLVTHVILRKAFWECPARHSDVIDFPSCLLNTEITFWSSIKSIAVALSSSQDLPEEIFPSNGRGEGIVFINDGNANYLSQILFGLDVLSANNPHPWLLHYVSPNASDEYTIFESNTFLNKHRDSNPLTKVEKEISNMQLGEETAPIIIYALAFLLHDHQKIRFSLIVSEDPDIQLQAWKNQVLCLNKEQFTRFALAKPNKT